MTDTLTPTLPALLREYRTLAGLTQKQLAHLTQQLVSEGKLTAMLTQQMISDHESGRYKSAHQPTLEVFAVALAHALQAQGYEGATPDELMRQFNDIKSHPKGGDLQAELIWLQGMLAVMPRWAQRIATRTLREMAAIMQEEIKAERARQKAGRGK